MLSWNLNRLVLNEGKYGSMVFLKLNADISTCVLFSFQRSTLETEFIEEVFKSLGTRLYLYIKRFGIKTMN